MVKINIVERTEERRAKMKLTDKLDILMEEKDIKNIRELSQLSGIPYMTIRNFWVIGAYFFM